MWFCATSLVICLICFRSVVVDTWDSPAFTAESAAADLSRDVGGALETRPPPFRDVANLRLAFSGEVCPKVGNSPGFLVQDCRITLASLSELV